MKLFDFRHPFFIPVWRRVATVAACLIWAVFEFSTLSPFWGVVFGGIGLVAAWQFFLSGWPAEGAESDDT